MNWIIRNTNKLKYHTNLFELTKPLQQYIDNYNWLFSDLDFITDKLPDLPINYDNNYFILSSDNFKEIINKDVQFVWGALLAVPKHYEIEVDELHLPFVEGNDAIWKNGNIQLKNADIEIDCFDSSYTIIKFRNEDISNVFKSYFDEAIKLEMFK